MQRKIISTTCITGLMANAPYVCGQMYCVKYPIGLTWILRELTILCMCFEQIR